MFSAASESAGSRVRDIDDELLADADLVRGSTLCRLASTPAIFRETRDGARESWLCAEKAVHALPAFIDAQRDPAPPLSRLRRSRRGSSYRGAVTRMIRRRSTSQRR